MFQQSIRDILISSACEWNVFILRIRLQYLSYLFGNSGAEQGRTGEDEGWNFPDMHGAIWYKTHSGRHYRLRRLPDRELKIILRLRRMRHSKMCTCKEIRELRALRWLCLRKTRNILCLRAVCKTRIGWDPNKHTLNILFPISGNEWKGMQTLLTKRVSFIGALLPKWREKHEKEYVSRI